MSSQELQRTRAHLLDNRQMIVGHAVAAAVVGLAPVPYVDEILPSLVKRRLVKLIAESRGVDLSDEAVAAIADGRVAPPSWRNLLGAAPLARFFRRSVRAALLALNVYRRAESASRTFAVATLFDHYCARQHVGGELSGTDARALRQRIDAVVTGSMGSLPAWAVKRGFARALGAIVRAPAGILQALRPKRLPPGEVEAEEIIEESLEVSRGGAIGAVEGQASGSFVDELVDAFERPHG